jgi:DNA topoisomerase-3
MQLDDIVSGRTDFRVVIDGIAAMAGQLIEVLRGTPASAVDLSLAAAAAVRGRRQSRAAVRRRPSKEPSAARAPRQRRSAKHTQPTASAGIAPQKSPHHSGKTRGAPPTAKMVAYAKSLAGNKKLKLPPGYAQDFETCRRFLDQHSR